MYDYIPYTYLIGWKKHHVWYYGVRYAKGCNPKDLWKTYFTSSEYVKNFRRSNGDPDIIQIRKCFSDRYSAQNWETKVLQRMKVIKDSRFLNKAIGKSIQDFDNRKNVMIEKYGVENPSQLAGVSKKISKSLKGKPKSEQHKLKLKESHNKESVKEIHSLHSKKLKSTQTLEKRREISSLGGLGNKGIPKSKEWIEKTNEIKRKTYLINSEIIVKNAKDYCKEHNLNYISFTQAAKHKKVLNGLKIEVLS